MKSTDQKKAQNDGMLCGLRATADSETDSATTEGPQDENLQQSLKETAASQRRPQSLTLPFENRDRESHLVSDEEFDRILCQEELNQPLPPLPISVQRSISGADLRRSRSTARNARLAMISQKPKQMSGDLSSMAEDHCQGPRPLSTSQREPTLTALPRPPTINDLLAYPIPQGANASANASSRTGIFRQHAATTNADTSPSSLDPQTQPEKKGHKRNYSAAGMLESMRKHIKREEAPRSSPDHPKPLTGSRSPLAGSPAASLRFTLTRPAIHPNDNTNGSGPHHDVLETDKTTTASSKDCPDIKKPLLQRTWFKTKHAARFSISSSLPFPSTSTTKTKTSEPPCPPALSAALASGRNTPTPSFLTQTTTNTSGYYASAETSPRMSSRPFTPPVPPSAPSTSPYEFISGPPPRRNLLRRLGGPPSRCQLNIIASRQQSRIVDLTLQNNVLVAQIDILRGELESLRMQGNQMQRKEPERQRSKDSQRLFRIEAPVSQGVTRGVETCARIRVGRGAISETGAGGDGSEAGTEEAYDPKGWKKIMGIKEDEDERVELRDDNKRKTWMTCDS